MPVLPILLAHGQLTLPSSFATAGRGATDLAGTRPRRASSVTPGEPRVVSLARQSRLGHSTFVYASRPVGAVTVSPETFPT